MVDTGRLKSVGPWSVLRHGSLTVGHVDGHMDHQLLGHGSCMEGYVDHCIENKETHESTVRTSTVEPHYCGHSQDWPNVTLTER